MDFEISKTEFHDKTLTLQCSGAFGPGTSGVPSGKKLQTTLEAEFALETTINHVFIDFTQVTNYWGDGVIWSTAPILLKMVTITFIASRENYDALLNTLPLLIKLLISL